MNNMDEKATEPTGERQDENPSEADSTPSRRGFRPAHFVLIAGLIALIVIIARNPGAGPGAGSGAIGQMPKFNLVKIAGGSLRSEDLKGKVLVVDFWASWCPPCKIEIPQYNKVVASMAGKDFQMIGYTVESGTVDEVRASAKELGIQYQVVMGTDDVSAGFGNYRGLPTTFVIGKNGKIYKKYEGAPPGKIAQIVKDVEELLAAPSESIAQLAQ